jgi:tRNA(Ile)-lysidine synthase TilS/MesJ
VVKLSNKILKQVGRTNGKFGLIGEGDRVVLGLSGGKDSLTLAHALKNMQRRAPFNFELLALTIDYGMGENFDALIEHCRSHEIPHEVVKTEIYSIAKENIRENSSSCSFFSRMRRGALYTETLKRKFNKLALGHHFDDAAESFFMNFTYNGAIRTLPPKYTAQNGLEVIRPLIQIRERQLIAAALNNSMPTIGDETCPSQHFDEKKPFARMQTKQMLYEMEEKFPSLFTSLNSAFSNVQTDSFFSSSD